MPTSSPFSMFALGRRCERLNPISATIAPVTTGRQHDVDPAGADEVHYGTDDDQDQSPTATSPPSALPAPCDAVTATTGAITEKLDPR